MVTARLLGLALAAVSLAGGSVAAAEAAAQAACVPAHPELMRGFSLNGWLDEPVPRPPNFAMLARLRARGLTHVRLPIGAESVMTHFTPPSVVEAHKRRIAAALDALLDARFAVVVDLHGGNRLEKLFTTDPKAARDAVIQAWAVLGPVIEPRAHRKVMAEILNEPPVSDATWDAFQTRIVAAARHAMPKTTFVVSTGGPQRVEHLTAAKPISDPNTVYAVHYYDPMVFTHQGAAWMKPDPIAWLHGIPFPIKPGDERLKSLAASLRTAGLGRVADYLTSLEGRSFGLDDINRDMHALGTWSKTWGRPVVLGEFGVYRDVAAPADRHAWLGAVSHAANAACVGWTHWDYRDGFGLVDAATERPDEQTLAALLGVKQAGTTP